MLESTTGLAFWENQVFLYCQVQFIEQWDLLIFVTSVYSFILTPGINRKRYCFLYGSDTLSYYCWCWGALVQLGEKWQHCHHLCITSANDSMRPLQTKSYLVFSSLLLLCFKGKKASNHKIGIQLKHKYNYVDTTKFHWIKPCFTKRTPAHS